jgi:acyl-CoA synthetase
MTAKQHELKYILALCNPKFLFIAERFRGIDYIQMFDELQKEMELPDVVVVNSGIHIPPSFLLFESLENMKLNNIDFDFTVSADDPLVVLFTSGTESQPKGVIHTHNTVLFTERSLIHTLSISEKDRMFMPSPISHATGFLHGVNLPLLAGACTVLMDHFIPHAALKIIAKEKCTFSMGATTFVNDLIEELSTGNDDYDLTPFRFFLCVGTTIPIEIMVKGKEKGIPILPVYGTSESSPHIVGRPEDLTKKNPYPKAKLIPRIEVRIVDEDRHSLPFGTAGEEASRGPNLFLGYFKQPELTEKYIDDDGWFYSGDLCVLNEDDSFQIAGRKKDIIIRGGLNISPLEVEELLLNHPKIQNVAIIGVPDNRLGEKSLAIIETKKGQSFSFEEMVQFLEQKNVAKYKFPEMLHILQELPRTNSGKIMKYQLRELFKNENKVFVN